MYIDLSCQFYSLLQTFCESGLDAYTIEPSWTFIQYLYFMTSYDVVQPIILQELLRDVWTELETDATFTRSSAFL